MKKIYSFFLLLGMLLSVGNVWAVETSYTITFKETGTSSDGNSQVNTIANIIADGATYVSEISNVAKVYQGRTGRGIKLGNSSTPGSLTLTLSEAVYPTKITFYARKYNDTEKSITVNGEAITELTENVVEYTKNYDGVTEVTAIEISTPLKRAYITQVTVYYEGGSQQTAVSTTTTIVATGITNTDVYTGTAAGSLSASVAVTSTSAAIDGATVTWSGNNDDVATINATTGAVTLVAAGTVTFTASYAGVENQYQASSNTYQMTVTNSDPDVPGTVNNPYTVAQAIAATPASGTSANVYIKGIVSKFYNTSIVGDGSNYRYYISDDGTQTNQLLVYKGKGLDQTTFSDASDLLLGDVVVIYGGLTTFSNASEVASGNYLVSQKHKPAAPTFSLAAGSYTSAQSVTLSCATDGATIYYTTDESTPTAESTVYSAAINVNATMTIKAIAIKEDVKSDVATAAYTISSTPYIEVSSNSIKVDAGGHNGTITVTYGNITEVVADVFFCDEGGVAASYDWVVANINASNNLEYLIEENTGAARTAYLKVWAYDDGLNEVYSELITISQKKAVEDGVFDFTYADELDYGTGLQPSADNINVAKTFTAGNITVTPEPTASGKYWRWWTDNTLRLYTDTKMTIAAPDGYVITGIAFTGTQNLDAVTVSSGNYEAANDKKSATWTGYAQSIVFTRNGSNPFYKTITVTYATSASLTLGTNGWSTFSAPFKFAVSGAEVYMAAPDAELNATKVILSKVENGIVPAEEGVILKGTEGATVTITPTDAEASDYDDNLNDLMNTAVAPAIASVGSNMYVLATDNNVTAFYPCGNITIPMYKAWMFIFPAQQGGAPEAIRIEFAENNATDIKSVEGSEKAVKFIENGKLYIQKDGVVYDVTGAVVR